MRPSERLYIQYKPSSSSQRNLLKLQAEALVANPQARPLPREGLHLTLLHFGIISEVFQEIKAVNKSLEWSSYDRALTDFIANCQAGLPEQVVVQATDFTMFGSRGAVLALAFAPTSQLVAAHRHCLEQLRLFLGQCRVEYIGAFMQGSRNLTHAATLTPHITLLRAARRRPELSDKPTLAMIRLPLKYPLA